MIRSALVHVARLRGLPVRAAAIPAFVVGAWVGWSDPRALAAPEDAPSYLLTPAKIADLRSVQDVSISPDGLEIAYVLSTPRNPEEKPGPAHASIWLVPFDGASPRAYTFGPGRATGVAWSSDGRRLAFLAARDGEGAKTRVHVLPVDGGEAEAVSDEKTNVSDFQWFPDGTRIVYRAPDPESDAEAAERKAGKDWTVAEENEKPLRLWSLDLATRKASPISAGAESVWEYDVSPDGKRIVATVSKSPRTDDSYMYKSLATYPAEGGPPETLAKTEGKLGPPLWSPDGSRVAFLGAIDLHDPTTGTLFVVPAGGGTPAALNGGFEGTGRHVEWKDRETLLLSSVEGVETTLRAYAAGGGRPGSLLVREVGLAFAGFSVSADGTRIALAASKNEHPNEVYTGEVGISLRRRTWSNPDLPSIRFGAQEEFRWKARDGLELAGLLVRPMDYRQGEAFPCVVQVHGGPEAAYVDGWNTGYGGWTHFLSQRGFVVFLPNYRGSTGRGTTFAALDQRDLGGAEFDDVLDGVDALVAAGLVDPERVGIGGGSYGGYLSAWAATRHSDRFAAAVVFAGIVDWLSFTGTTDIPWENSLVHWNLVPFVEPALALERSPVGHVRRSKTPTLLLHGEVDARVPPGQGRELFTALRMAGVETKLVTYPREAHGIRERAHQVDFLDRVAGWFETHVRDRGKKPASP